MKLVAHELVTTLRQKITVSEDMALYAVRPHLIKHGSPAGSLIFQIEDANQRVIKQSAAVAISSISAVAYAHGLVRFLLDTPLRADTSYYLALTSTGYTYSTSAWVGWCNDFDLRIVDASYSPNAGLRAALRAELWVRKAITKGQA